jgi:hypothetical protein
MGISLVCFTSLRLPEIELKGVPVKTLYVPIKGCLDSGDLIFDRSVAPLRHIHSNIHIPTTSISPRIHHLLHSAHIYPDSDNLLVFLRRPH